MTQTIRIRDGFVTLIESKAECPYCSRFISFEEIEHKWVKQNNHFMRMKCKCKRFIGITADIKGDFVAFKL